MDAKFSDLIGKTLVAMTGLEKNSDRVDLFTADGEHFVMRHQQDCCESVSIDDIVGNIEDLIDSPITMADEATSDENPNGVTKEYLDSFTWTFYKLATVKGYVDIRWYGESNGYYSEGVDFEQVTP